MASLDISSRERPHRQLTSPDLGLMAAYGFLILILINIVVLAFLNTLYRTEKAARAADQP